MSGPRVAAVDLKSAVLDEALRLGFDAARVTTPDAIGSAAHYLTAFLQDGRHGDMDWMERHAARRADPRALMPGVRSIVMLAMSYAPKRNPLEVLEEKSRGAVSAYAKGSDYHDVLKRRLKALAGRLQRESGGADVKVFVDTAPLMEKPLAAAAGIGWQGKHTNLVSRTHGSWLFLGAILTSAELEPDASEGDHCGTCRRCLDICPTDAFPSPYQLDARRCIAYLTIEHKGHIAPAFRDAMGNRVFGCDDCLAVCPWNKFAAASREATFAAREATNDPPLADLLDLDDAAFRRRFAGTPIKRTGRNRIMRNTLIAAGNSGDAALAPRVARHLRDDAAVVRAMAVWAIARLCDADETAVLRRTHLPVETDNGVREEWIATEGR